MVDMRLDYSFLISKINSHYKATTIEQKIVMLCKDAKIKLFRFKRIIENIPKCYFLNDEMFRIIKTLGLKPNEINKCFFKEI